MLARIRYLHLVYLFLFFYTFSKADSFLGSINSNIKSHLNFGSKKKALMMQVKETPFRSSIHKFDRIQRSRYNNNNNNINNNNSDYIKKGRRSIGILSFLRGGGGGGTADYKEEEEKSSTYGTTMFSSTDNNNHNLNRDYEGLEHQENSNKDKFILVTGGAGYIGSHTCVELINSGYKLIVIDNLINSDSEAINRVRKITNCKSSDLIFIEIDLLDRESLTVIFEKYNIESCVHFAGLKAVGESCSIPMKYYHNNIVGTINLLEIMERFNCKKIVFSSSATVYGDPEQLPITEDQRLITTNPYGRTKLFIEEILRDLYRSDPSWSILILRYFNPIGAHSSGLIGEDPQGIPNNLMPFIAQVAVGRRPTLSVFGNDYNTRDGTGVRDYIHVVDLAKGHVAAIQKLSEYETSKEEETNKIEENMRVIEKAGQILPPSPSSYESQSLGCISINLGTGNGVSVLELVEGMREASGKEIPVKITERRPGDVAELYTDPTFAANYLKWHATRGTKEMCEDTWKWQSNNPLGYQIPDDKDESINSSNEAQISKKPLESHRG